MNIDIVHAIMRPMTKEQQRVKQNLKDFCLRIASAGLLLQQKNIKESHPIATPCNAHRPK